MDDTFHVESHDGTPTNKELINAALDALVWLTWFRDGEAIRAVIRRGTTLKVIDDQRARLQNTIAELERVTAGLEWTEMQEKQEDE